MKPNVDLTENRKFQSLELPNISDEIYTNILYELNCIQSCTTDIILTGNTEDRICKRIALDFSVNNNHCDCCGETIPWKFIGKSSLCDKCLEEMEESDNSYLRTPTIIDIAESFKKFDNFGFLCSNALNKFKRIEVI